MADKELADYAREAIAQLPSKRILSKEDMRQVIRDAVKANGLAQIKPDDPDNIVRAKEMTASILSDLTANQVDYEWDMLYVVWKDFLTQR